MTEPVRWSASRQGGDVVVRAEIDPPWHIYSTRPSPPDPSSLFDGGAGGAFSAPTNGPTPTTVSVEAPDRVTALVEPEPESMFDSGFGTTVLVHHESVELVATTDAERVSVRFQACDGHTCLPPSTVILDTTVPH